VDLTHPSLIARILLERIEVAASGYALTLFQYVRVILIALALLDLIRLAYDVWTSNQGPDAALPRLGRWILYMCGVAAIVQTSHQVWVGGDSVARYVYDLFREWGERASGIGGFTPATMFDRAIEMAIYATDAIKRLGLWNPFAVASALFAVAILLAIFAAFAYLVFLFYFLFLEWFVALALAPAFLVTAAHKWTAGIAEGYISYLVQLGYRTLALFFCYPIATVFIDEVRDAFIEAVQKPGPNLEDFLMILYGTAFAVGMLALVVGAVRAYANRVAPQGRVFNLGGIFESI